MKPFKTQLLLWGFFFLSYLSLSAQNSIDADDFTIDYAAPNISAFSLLGIDNDQISRPGNIRKLMVELQDLIASEQIVPGVAVEVNPIMLLGASRKKGLSEITRDNYIKNQWKRGFHLNLASLTDSSGGRIAAGFRWVILDRSDPFIVDSIRKAYINLLQKESSGFTELRKKLEYQRKSGENKVIQILIKAYLVEMKITPPDTSEIKRQISIIEQESKNVPAHLLTSQDQYLAKMKNALELCRYLQKGTSSKDFQDFALALREITDDHLPPPTHNSNTLPVDSILEVILDQIEGSSDLTKPSPGSTLEKELKSALRDLIHIRNGNVVQFQSFEDNYHNSLLKKVEDLKKDLKDKNWNHASLQLSGGAVWSSSDASWENLNSDKFSVLASGSFPLDFGSENNAFKGQLTAQAMYRCSFQENVLEKQKATFGVQLLLGNPNLRLSTEFITGFAQTKQSLADERFDQQSLVKGTLGLEMKLVSGVWLDLDAGMYRPSIGTDPEAKMLFETSLKYAFIKNGE